ncbi:acyltransferase [Uliginosibacterium sp. H3]|uniref:Acyltransferase n=1 Tax=Uliginosibacterium silvisoli TaxID=3114758 RepID=A0ABU6K2D6_9RHOO|nr:acyltransferase [Uliginosibacterium sp. H3]
MTGHNRTGQVRRAKIQSLEAGRGIAALLVTVYHFQQTISHNTYAPFWGLFEFGSAGVDFFFVLSGFIIYFVHSADVDSPHRLAHYVWKRVTRIYPLFLFVMIFVAAKAVLKHEFAWDYFIKSLLLIPQQGFPMLGPSWTLVQEMLFYGVFGVFIVSRKAGFGVVGLWLALNIFSLTVARPVPGSLIQDSFLALTSKYNLLFVFGICVAWLVTRREIRAWRAIATTGLVLFLALGIVESTRSFSGSDFSKVVLYGLASAMIILGLASGELSGHISAGKYWSLLGELSYPLYLSHMVLFGLMQATLTSLGLRHPDLLLLVSVALSCGVAIILNRYVEHPLSSALRTLWARRTMLLPRHP